MFYNTLEKNLKNNYSQYVIEDNKNTVFIVYTKWLNKNIKLLSHKTYDKM